MDLVKLSKVADSVQNPDTRAEKLKAIKDSLSKNRKLRSAKQFRKFKVSDAFKALRKKIKDALETTETTDEAIETVVGFLNDYPAEEVIPAAIDVIGEAVDALEDKIKEVDLDNEPDPKKEGESGEDNKPVEDSFKDGDEVYIEGKWFRVVKVTTGEDKVTVELEDENHNVEEREFTLEEFSELKPCV